MSSGIGWVETEGTEDNAQEAGIPDAGGDRAGSQNKLADRAACPAAGAGESLSAPEACSAWCRSPCGAKPTPTSPSTQTPIAIRAARLIRIGVRSGGFVPQYMARITPK